MLSVSCAEIKKANDTAGETNLGNFELIPDLRVAILVVTRHYRGEDASRSNHIVIVIFNIDFLKTAMKIKIT
jgi:hypothetical protein